MATKAERFRSDLERARHNRPKQPSRRPPLGAIPHPVQVHNASKAAARKAPYMLEVAVSNARPSRKSTRRAANRSKPDSNLKGRQTRATTAPSERSQRP